MCNDHSQHLSRRSLIAAGATTVVMGGLADAYAQTSPSAAPPTAVSPDEALKRLADGNTRYSSNTSINRDMSAGRAGRAQAQYPFAALVSCSDSRVAPELAFDQGPGDLFVVRVAGNFVNTDGLASLEYGVKILGIPLIVVLGHSNCGAVAATIKVLKEKTKLPGHLPQLVNAIKPSIDLVEKQKAADPLAAAIAQNVRYNVERLRRAKPIVAEAVAAQKVKLAGAVYDIGTGKVSWL
jgi:carbonic anhydrase